MLSKNQLLTTVLACISMNAVATMTPEQKQQKIDEIKKQVESFQQLVRPIQEKIWAEHIKEIEGLEQGRYDKERTNQIIDAIIADTQLEIMKFARTVCEKMVQEGANEDMNECQEINQQFIATVFASDLKGYAEVRSNAYLKRQAKK